MAEEYDPKDLVHLQGLEPKQRTTHPESVTCLRCRRMSNTRRRMPTGTLQ